MSDHLVKALAPQHPEWQDREPFKSLLAGDLKGALAGGEKALVQLVMVSHAGMTTDEFEQSVKGWLAIAKHPRFNRLPSPQRGRRGRGKPRSARGRGHALPPLAPLPTSPRWGEEYNASVKEAFMKNLPCIF